ncbi:MAG TPA: retropepsin-like aspartic protease [Candidatus Paceibacterota bacterium]
MEKRFSFEKRWSQIFGEIWRPVALVDFASINELNTWTTVRMIVDTGADYSLLPRSYAKALNVDLERDCQPFETAGIGGKELVFVHPQIRIRIGEWEREVPVGFLERDTVPPLLGRQQFLEVLSVLFENHTTTFRTQTKT